MKKTLAWLLFPLYFGLTLLTLCVWDVILKILVHFHAGIHKWVLDQGIHLLLIHLRILGTRIRLTVEEPLPVGRPVVVVSNHQSVFDIPLLMWYLRPLWPVFVAKKELGKWIPSVSCTLRSNGSILIDRKDATQAIPAIRALGEQIERRKIAACIFPEGTRARDGEVRKFKPSGLLSLLASAPNALVLPVAIDGSWRLVKYGLLPVPVGLTINLRVLKALQPPQSPDAEFVTNIETLLRAHVSRGSEPEKELPPGS